MFTLRPYQQSAVDASVRYLRWQSANNGLLILPTGSGKSLVIANIIKSLNEPVLVFQPSKEILEQNHAKYETYGFNAGIFSASLDLKQIYPTTFATIGSAKARPEMFRVFRYVIIDECHQVNPKRGMYRDFLAALGGARVLGLTATPYRLTTDGFGGSILKFITRTRPRVFTDVVYYINNSSLFAAGFLSKLRYVDQNGFDRTQLKLNTTGADYDDQSIRQYYRKTSFGDKVLYAARTVLQTRKNALIFTRFTDEARYVAGNLSGSAILTADTSKSERESIIAGFRSGSIRVVANVGVLTTGFDYPELEAVILARPTMSLAMYYQMIGRAIRPHPAKPDALILDLCGNIRTFGQVENLRIENDGGGRWYVANEQRRLTNVYFGRL